MRYQAGPELSSRESILEPVSRAIDIWSFGCVLSLAATWIVLGSEGIKLFRILREQAHKRLPATTELGANFTIGAFHDGHKLLDDIYDWHHFLRSSSRRSDEITLQMLDLVERWMLKRDPNDRAPANELCFRMRSMLSSSRASAASDIAPSVLEALSSHNVDINKATRVPTWQHLPTLRFKVPDFSEPVPEVSETVTADEELPRPYEYQRLVRDRSIRLMRLLPAENRDEEIFCQLEETQLVPGAVQEYDALSYTWGDTSEASAIKIQNGQDVSLLNVTPNLISCLKCLRLKHETRTLWADAICIDQNNVAERNNQVPMMKLIYGNASKVLVWLGEADEGSDVAIEFIKEEVLKLQAFDELSEIAAFKLRALVSLMTRNWFSRR